MSNIDSVSAVLAGARNPSGVVMGKNSLNTSDFFRLIAAQLSHQDVLNPSDSTQFMAQMAQFSTLQTMENTYQAVIAQLSSLGALLDSAQIRYGAALIGKSVTVETFDEAGNVRYVTGIAERVSLDSSEITVYVDGKAYPLSGVTEIALPQSADGEGSL